MPTTTSPGPGKLEPGVLESFVAGDPSTAVQRVLVIVSLHGDEPCGVTAVNTLVEAGFFAQFESAPGSCDACRDPPIPQDDDESGPPRFGPVALALTTLRSGRSHGNDGIVTPGTAGALGACRAVPRCACEMSVEVVLGNPAAYAANKRYLACNMNRLLHPDRVLRVDPETSTPTAAAAAAVESMGVDERTERTRAAFVLDAIDRCDALLDLHSCSATSPPFALPALAGISSEAAMGLPTGYVIDRLAHCTVQGGTSLDRFMTRCRGEAKGGEDDTLRVENGVSGSTVANPRPGQVAGADHSKVEFVPGPWVGVTLECGKHTDPASPIIAERAIRAFLTGRRDPLEPSLISKSAGGGGEGAQAALSSSSSAASATTTEATAWPKHLVSHESVRVAAKFEFARHWPQFARVEPGTVVCTNDGVPVTCNDTGGAYIIMPARDPREGEEAFFWGVDKPPWVHNL